MERGSERGRERIAMHGSLPLVSENDVGSAEAPLVKEYHILRQCNHSPIQRDIFIRVPHMVLQTAKDEFVRQDPREKENGKIDPSKRKEYTRWMNKPYAN
jgi:hypothetical protein